MKDATGEEWRQKVAKRLQRSHVIEGMVQLLTNGLVLQLLSIQLVWRADVNSKYSRWQGQPQEMQELGTGHDEKDQERKTKGGTVN